MGIEAQRWLVVTPIPEAGALQNAGRHPSCMKMVSVLEVSQTGDRGRFEDIQPFAMTARVGGFVD
jgi:hypothetical protein